MSIWNKKNTGKPNLTDNARASIDLIADRIDNVEKGLAGDDNLTTIDINGGAIDGTPIGSTTPSTGKFTTVKATDLTATDLTASGVVSLTGTADIDIITNADDINLTSTSGDINLDSGTGRTKITTLFAGYGSLSNQTSNAISGTVNKDVTVTKDSVMMVQSCTYQPGGGGSNLTQRIMYADSGTPTEVYWTVNDIGSSTATHYPALTILMKKNSIVRFQFGHSGTAVSTGTIYYRIQEIGA